MISVAKQLVLTTGGALEAVECSLSKVRSLQAKDWLPFSVSSRFYAVPECCYLY